MSRIRTIKPAAFSSESLSRVSVAARWTFAGLWTYADDEGRGKAEPRLIKAHVWPLDDDVTAADVERMLTELEREGMIHRYVVDNRAYMAVVNWHHQRVSHPSPSVLPVPANTGETGTVESPLETSRTAREDSGEIREASVSRAPARSQSSSLSHSPSLPEDARARGTRLADEWTPDLELVTAMRAEGIPDELARRELPKFRDYWHGLPGAKGRKSNWPATWRNWLRRAAETNGRASPNGATTDARVSEGLALAARLRDNERRELLA